MEIEINPLWKLANPAYALAWGLAIICSVAVAAHFLSRNRSQARRWQALLSEGLVAVGVIGLLTFAARVYMDGEIRRDATQLSENKRLARVASLNLEMRYCLPRQSSARPTPEMEGIWVACSASDQLLNSDEKPFQYQIAQDQLAKISNLSHLNVELANSIEALKRAVSNVIKSFGKKEQNNHQKKLVESDISWVLILLCAVSAMLGIGLKWAKAFFEFRKAAAR